MEFGKSTRRLTSLVESASRGESIVDENVDRKTDEKEVDGRDDKDRLED